MASHLPWPEFPQLPDPDPPGSPPLDSPPSSEMAAPPDFAAIFHTLQQLITAGTRDNELILGKIAEAAQSLTGASGTAIATRKAGVVICQGRSGDTAPALGTRLSVDSGISGECLRTGKALRCDDTSKDSRADQEVCRQLGLQSIAAVPLRQRGEAAGILEAFATRPHAFSEEQMDLLAGLAKLAEAAAFESAREVEAAPDLLQQAELEPSEAQSERRQRYRLAGVALAINILLFSAVGWKMRHNSATRIVRSQRQPTLPTTAQPMTQTEAPDGSRHDSVPQVGVPDVGDRAFTSASRSATDTAELQGLSGGVLVRKVRPTYPPQALALHLRGSVLLQAIITEDGEVRDPKVKGGHPLLVPAAVEAVSQWRYRPFLLNGKPIQNRVDISVDFKMPQ
jgi:TonB family protein